MHWVESNEKYTGQWKDNLQNGYGIHIWYDSNNTKYLRNRYVGLWKNGARNGYGVFFYANGTKYEGMWENNEKHGYGLFQFLNGTEYIGRFIHDRMIDYNTSGLVNANGIKNDLVPVTTSDNSSNNRRISNVMNNIGDSKVINSDKMGLPLIDTKPIKKKKKTKELEVIMEHNNEIASNKKVINDKTKLNIKGGNNKPEEIKNNPTKINITKAKSPTDKQPKSKSKNAKKLITNTNNQNSTITTTPINFLASNQMISESDSNQFKSMIDISDILETSTSIAETSKLIENTLLRNLTELKQWYHKLTKPEKNDEINDKDTIYCNTLRLDEGQLNLNDFDDKLNNEMNTSFFNEQTKDDKMGQCMEMKDIWKFFRDYDIISIEMTISQFNRCFYKGQKNQIEMFYLPEEIPRLKLYDYIYLMISKAKVHFENKYHKYLPKNIINESHDSAIDEHLDTPRPNREEYLKTNNTYNQYYSNFNSPELDINLLSFDYHNQHNTILLRQFYEAIIRAAYIRFYDYNCPIFQKIEMLISKFSMKLSRSHNNNKTRTILNKSKSSFNNTNNMNNISISGIGFDLANFVVANMNNNILSQEQKQRNIEHSLIDAFIIKYEFHLKPIFRKLSSKYTYSLDKAINYKDLTFTYRFLYYNFIRISKEMKCCYPNKKSLCDIVSYYFKEKRNDLVGGKDLYEYYELLLDLEMTFYEFCEWMYFLSQKYIAIEKEKNSNESEENKIKEIIAIAYNVAYMNNGKKFVKILAKNKVSYPLLRNHVIKQGMIDERLWKEHQELLKRLDKQRYIGERMSMDMEGQLNAYIEEIENEDDEDDEDFGDLSF